MAPKPAMRGVSSPARHGGGYLRGLCTARDSPLLTGNPTLNSYLRAHFLGLLTPADLDQESPWGVWGGDGSWIGQGDAGDDSVSTEASAHPPPAVMLGGPQGPGPWPFPHGQGGGGGDSPVLLLRTAGTW